MNLPDRRWAHCPSHQSRPCCAPAAGSAVPPHSSPGLCSLSDVGPAPATAGSTEPPRSSMDPSLDQSQTCITTNQKSVLNLITNLYHIQSKPVSNPITNLYHIQSKNLYQIQIQTCIISNQKSTSHSIKNLYLI